MAGILPHELVYKPVLTNKDWQKKKGTIGKMTKTGLGDKLNKAEALFKKINVVALDPSSNPSKSMDELKAKVEAAKKEYKKSIVPLQKALRDVEKCANDAAKTLNKKTGGGSAAKAAQAIAKEADWLAVGCKSIDLEGPIAKVKADIKKKDDLARKFLEQSLKKFLVGSKTYLKNPSYAAWGTHIKQQGRSVSNSVAQIGALRAKFWKDFEKFKGFDEGTLGLNKDDPKMPEKGSMIVKKAQAQVAAIAKAKI